MRETLKVRSDGTLRANACKLAIMDRASQQPAVSIETATEYHSAWCVPCGAPEPCPGDAYCDGCPAHDR